MNLLSNQILDFIFHLSLDGKMPRGVSILNPYIQPESKRCCEIFYRKFYQKKNPRVLVLGINPGRLGAGLTGIPFTDPVHLDSDCGIENSFIKKTELTSEFIYQVIKLMGGPAAFYTRFYISAVCPLGFVKEQKNLNYYDVHELKILVEQKLPEWINKQLEFGISNKVCICVGEGKNFEFLAQMNQKHKWFDKLIALPHPRFIMQYKRRQLKTYLKNYEEELSAASSLL